MGFALHNSTVVEFLQPIVEIFQNNIDVNDYNLSFNDLKTSRSINKSTQDPCSENTFINFRASINGTVSENSSFSKTANILVSLMKNSMSDCETFDHIENKAVLLEIIFSNHNQSNAGEEQHQQPQFLTNLTELETQDGSIILRGSEDTNVSSFRVEEVYREIKFSRYSLKRFLGAA